jgi:hypothetical protein
MVDLKVQVDLVLIKKNKNYYFVDHFLNLFLVKLCNKHIFYFLQISTNLPTAVATNG